MATKKQTAAAAAAKPEGSGRPPLKARPKGAVAAKDGTVYRLRRIGGRLRIRPV